MGFPLRFRKISVSLLFTLISTTTLLAQTVIKRELPDTQWIKVTFFDFHSNKSNPEFECPHLSGTYKNMAADTLPEDSIPLKGKTPYINEYFKYWYTPWDSEKGGKGDRTIPYYRTDRVVGNPAEFNSEVVFDSSGVVNHDTAFINKVIKDSLPFRLVDRDRGIYRFEDTTFFPLDTRGFGREGRSHNYSFTMSLNTEFTYKPGLMFTFKGDDDVWTYVNRKLAIDLGGIHNSVTGTIDSIALKNMNLTLGNKYPLDFYYAERHTDNSKIMIETNLFQPELVLDLSAEPDIVVEYGTIVTLKADVRDQDTIPYPDLSKKTKWRIVYSNAHQNTDFVSDSGANVQFKTRVAFDTIFVEGSIYVDGAGTLRDTIKIITIAGPDCKISIEPTIVTESSPLELRRNFNQIDTIYFFDSTVTRDAYAVVRDCNGAFKRMSSIDLTQWSAVDNIIKIKGEDGKKYHGIIERYSITSRGTTLAIAKEEPDTLVPDSVPVVIRDYYPVRLRLVLKGHSVINDYLSEINIETDSSQEYEVYALISTAVDKPDDPASWIRLRVDWDLSSPLDSGISPIEPRKPDHSDKWTFNPIKAGIGNLELVNPEDIRTEKLVLKVTVIESAPSIAEIRIITPIQERIAGHTLKAEVIIKNLDGRVQGPYCFGNGNPEDGQVIYQDILPKGGDKRLDPTMTVDGVTQILNTENGTTYKHNQCFMNGIDTVDFVLYYAPYPDDSLHQITVILRNNLKASSEKFRLLADTLKTLVLTHDIDGKDPITDTIRLTKNSSKAVYSHGYDQYGNYRGPEDQSIWNTSGELPQTNPENNQGKMYTIFHSNPVDPISGDLCASVNIPGSNKTVSACAQVYMYGSDASIMRAITRDINGNGYLDRIDITFSKNFRIPESSTGNFTVAAKGYTFEVERVVALEGDSVYALYLKEEHTTVAQTDWQPYLSMNGIDGTTDEKNKLVDDGAAPVIWTVTKNMPTTSHVDDIVTIVFSEKIEGFNIVNTPNMVFWIYFKSSSGDMTKVDLFSDAKFIDYDHQKTVKIKVNKNVDINNNNWVNIRYENELVKDALNNKPDSMNQKVQVIVDPVDPRLQIGPNPFSPSSDIKPGKIELHHDQDALYNVRHGGVVIEITLPLPTDGSKVYVSLKIYDVAGNLVNYSGKTDIIEDLRNQNIDVTLMQASQFTLDYLWPGHNKKGMKLAPGIYKAVVIIDYVNNTYHDTRLIKMVGVGK